MTFAMTFASYMCGAVIIGSFVWIGVAMYFAHTKMEKLLELLPNCTAVTDHVFVRNIGTWGKLLLIGGIAGLVTFPGIHLKYGRASISDLEKIPFLLKRKLKILHLCGLGLLIGLFISVGLASIFEKYSI